MGSLTGQELLDMSDSDFDALMAEEAGSDEGDEGTAESEGDAGTAASAFGASSPIFDEGLLEELAEGDGPWKALAIDLLDARRKREERAEAEAEAEARAMATESAVNSGGLDFADPTVVDRVRELEQVKLQRLDASLAGALDRVWAKPGKADGSYLSPETRAARLEGFKEDQKALAEWEAFSSDPIGYNGAYRDWERAEWERGQEQAALAGLGSLDTDAADAREWLGVFAARKRAEAGS
jgi:hypothetical protein